jgi:predicted alpha/beta hydrolase family esterase
MNELTELATIAALWAADIKLRVHGRTWTVTVARTYGAPLVVERADSVEGAVAGALATMRRIDAEEQAREEVAS